MIIDTKNLKPGVYAINVFEEDRPLVDIDWRQGWFWEEDWIMGELEAQKEFDLAKEGKIVVESFQNMDDFLEGLL